MGKYVSFCLLVSLLLLPFSVQSEVQTQGVGRRRVNVPYAGDTVDWTQSAIFWFGENEHYSQIPGRNYTDVRITYTAQALVVRLVVVDYYLWQRWNPTLSDDLTEYDAAAIYVDTGLDQATVPQTDDYWFLIGARFDPHEATATYRRQARGTGTAWDMTWSGAWTDYAAMQWANDGGPNNNDGHFDYGWTVIFTVPWMDVGLSGPPEEGTVWGLGVELYDQDVDPDAGGQVARDAWPETFGASSPATWGELHFGHSSYESDDGTPEGVTVIRAISTTDNTVEDAWMGGGGTCSGGHEGGSEINHGDSTNLFVGTETAATHFPCFSKSYLRFSLDAIPPGKVILSATLTLHLWGNAGDPGQALPSWVHLFTVRDPWDEMTIHWNNAPLAHENVSATWVNPYSNSVIQWPGDPYEWDATQAVAEAYEAMQPVSLAIYGSDKDQHSSKYLLSSETSYTTGRPTLTVVWGSAITVDKRAQTQPLAGESTLGVGGTITYTIEVIGAGQALTVTDVLPAQVSHPSSYTSSSGMVSYNAGQRTLTWADTPAAGQAATITFPVTVVQEGTYRLVNTVHLVVEDGSALTDDCAVFVDPWQAFLPVVLRGW